MKIWGVLCLLGSLSTLNAYNTGGTDRSDNREERSGVTIPTHFDDESHKESSSKDHTAEPSIALREANESIVSSQEEIEKPEPYLIITTDKLASPGGGIPLLDPKVANEIILPTFPEAVAPWWERWWSDVEIWLFGEDS